MKQVAERAFRRLPRGARHALREIVVGRPFLTLSPHLLVAIEFAFRHLRERDSSSPADFLRSRAYYEFGLYRGFSLWYAQQIAIEQVADDFEFLGFDSFRGLPPSDSDGRFYRQGDFSAAYREVVDNLRAHGAEMTRIELFPGFYGPELFERIARTRPLPAAAISVIDVDIYESCREVLRFLEPRLEAGSLLIFDDFNDMDRSDAHGERRALSEFRLAFPRIQLDHVRDFGHEAALFEVASI